jgi:hypothetical protein
MVPTYLIRPFCLAIALHFWLEKNWKSTAKVGRERQAVKLIIVRQPAKGTVGMRKEMLNSKGRKRLSGWLNEFSLQIEETDCKGRKFSKCLTYV